jgi:HEAT repeat protein
MYEKYLTAVILTLIMTGLTGCSRTVEDVVKWEASENIEKLTGALSDPKAEVREAALQSLATLKLESTIDDIAACFNDSEDSVVLASVNALAAMESPSTVTPLIAALKLENPAANMTAAEALGTLKAPSAVKPLAEMLDRENEEELLTVITAMGSIGRQAGSRSLVDTLSSSSSATVRMACIDALSATGGSVALNGLVDTLSDSDDLIREAAKSSLIKIGDPAIPSIIDGLRSDDRVVRKASVALLSDLDAIPVEGDTLAWYQMARATTDESKEIDPETVSILTGMGMDAIPPLLEAAAHSDADIRDYAVISLESIGEPCGPKATTLVLARAKPDAKAWFQGRTDWSGAPSWRIDLWGAIAALNPQFEYDADTEATLKSGGSEAIALLARPDFMVTRPHIPLLINLLGDKTCAEAARKKLTSAELKAAFPLIAALEDENIAIAESAAAILAPQEDPRAYDPLTNVLQRRIDAGEPLSNSSIYTAMIKLNRLEADPLLQKIRPNTARAIQLFERQYRDARVIAADTMDPYTDYEAPIVFHLAYQENGAPGRLDVTFRKDSQGNWLPSPALPYTL